MRAVPKKEGYLTLGVVTSAHGIKGEVNVKVFAGDKELFLIEGAIIGNDGSPFIFDSVRSKGEGLIAKIKGCADRNKAEELKGTAFFFDLSHLPEDDDEIYFQELEGMEVIREDGSSFGKITYTFNNNAHEVLAVDTKKGEILIPFTDDVIVDIDREERKVIVTPMADEFLELV